MPKASHLKAGADAEAAAHGFLERQGLTLLARNYQCRYGEIDLIMRDDRELVFVEVRYRKHSHFGMAAETVTPQKQSRLRATAAYYLQQTGSQDTPCRFDIIAFNGGQITNPDWLRNAFC